MRRAIVAGTVLGLLLAFTAPVHAARKPIPATFAVTPTEIHVGDTFTVTGAAGLFPDGTAKVNWCNPGCLVAFAASWSDGTGSFSQTAWFPGTHRAWFLGRDEAGRLVRTSEFVFEVVP